MTAPESHDNHVVEEEQRIIDQALDTLIDIHRAEAAGGYTVDYGVDFLCRHTILNHHEAIVRKAWDEFYAVYNLDGEA
ncbi:hypothetical protein ACL1IT_01185 [Corynebacterium striatum]|uniref:Uncharacterized protein n=1 Tax=Corynebacterium striatum TaxID=43770 RepID=A0AAQ1TY40_CORST|nr:hypothetical protein [Corynebacterium striatum]EEI77667.1 hypothetical protein HMPREF0308_2043 [Corynebacterium striatum ATCC 6940]PIS66292.1 hypothetical protein AZH46_04185 [Corynebacterium striatum]PIS66363.1 hypothetical protein AZH46_07340 [Corynebacterium striatum]PXY09180.1 hypothetical protein CKF53_00270 [Corynebacterium striatum]QQE52071.1 hypothetical protein I6I11_07830 [Corynebacterium striatum]